MNHTGLDNLLDQLISNWEGECVEFKEANDNFSTSDIGKYFSALSNEANLRKADRGWLIFGVKNSTRAPVGTTYRENNVERLESIKKQIGDGSTTTFREVYEHTYHEHRLVIFEIAPAPKGLPIPWNGHYYARDHESLVALSDAKRDEIRAQAPDDWSAAICEKATIDDLDPAAITKARDAFSRKYRHRLEDEDVANWSDSEFLDRAKITINGAITRAAILLLGKNQSTHYLSPYVAEITWRLDGEVTGYEHFHPPFILETSTVFNRIRNVNLTLHRPGDLIPLDILKYDQRIVLEALHNCIAHQDYNKQERIVVIETPHDLVFQNAGNFFEGTPDDYIIKHRTPTRYRNRFLTEAMVNLRMIDSMGFGIHDVMFRGQAKRFLPLPEYDLSEESRVTLKMPGRFVDENYSRLLAQNTELTFGEIFVLDRIQKGLDVKKMADVVKELRSKGIIEGRQPKLRISSALVASAKEKADYIKHRAFDDSYYEDLILDYLKEFGKASREDINRLLMDKLSSALDEKQKNTKIRNLLQKMKKKGAVASEGATQSAVWIIPETD